MGVNTVELRVEMIRKGINTVKELSQKANLSQKTIVDVLGKKARPSLKTIEKIAEALEIKDESRLIEIFFTPDLLKK